MRRIFCLLVCSSILAKKSKAFTQCSTSKLLPIRLHLSPTVLATSISTPSSALENLTGDGDLHNAVEFPSYNHFRAYLKDMKRFIKSKTTLANRMDDELKRLEIQVYNLTGQEAPTCRYPPSDKCYGGPPIEPCENCYAMVCNAYAKSGLGRLGAELAEEVYKRYEKQMATGQRPSKIIKTAVLSAWAHADDWGKADEWLQQMENQFAVTKNEQDAPDMISYTCYIDGMANSRTLRGDEIARRSLEILDRTHKQARSGVNPFALPNRYSYISVMKCQIRSGKEIESIDDVERIYRMMEEEFHRLQRYDLKPKSVAAMPIFNAAARSRGGIKAAKRGEIFLKEIKDRYEATGDQDYRPLEGMYTSL
jgi:hypothetical protein